MKVKRRVLFLTLALLTFGFARANAKSLVMNDMRMVSQKPSMDAGLGLGVLTFTADNIGLFENRLLTDSILTESVYVNFTFQPKYTYDSTDFRNINIYLNIVFPVIMKMDTMDIDMIEIL